jgi:hypothetical protein
MIEPLIHDLARQKHQDLLGGAERFRLGRVARNRGIEHTCKPDRHSRNVGLQPGCRPTKTEY